MNITKTTIVMCAIVAMGTMFLASCNDKIESSKKSNNFGCSSLIVSAENLGFIKDQRVKEYVLKNYSGWPMYVGLDQDSLFKAYKNAASGATATVREYSRKMKKNCFPDDSVYLVKSGDQLSIHEQSRVITYNYLNPHGKTTSFAAGGYDVIYPVLNCDHPISFQTSKNTYPYLSRGTAQFNEGVKTLKKAFPEFALKFEGKIEY